LFIGSGVKDIDYRAFTDTPSLEEITVSENNPNFTVVDNVLFTKDKTMLVRFPSASARTSYDVPDGVVSIGEYAFRSCGNLKEITLPDTLEYIGESSFRGSGVISITIPDSVTRIGALGFSGANSLKYLFIGSGVEYIEYRAFMDTPSLEEITVSENNPNFTVVDNVLFTKDKTMLVRFLSTSERTSYDVPDGVVSIQGYAFYWCRNLKAITLPDTLENIGYASFEYAGITDIVIPDSVVSLYVWAFTKNSLQSVTIGKNVKSIYSTTFIDTGGLTKVTFTSPTPPEYVAEDAFSRIGKNAIAVVPKGSTAYGAEGSLWYGLIVTFEK